MFSSLGIGPELLARAGVFRVTDQEARAYGFRFSPTARLDGLVFPYFDPVSGHRVTARLRRDYPETDSNGRSRGKYVTAYGDTQHLFFPPDCQALLEDTSVPVVFPEAEKSSLALVALSTRAKRPLLAVGTGGCWSWRGRIGMMTNAQGERIRETGPLPDLMRINWELDRVAIVAFDSNTATNPKVRHARWEFAEALAALGAKVFFGDIPDEGGANGPDDLVKIAGDEAILAILDSARPFALQAENDAEEALKKLSKLSSLEDRDAALALIAAVSNFPHQRVWAARAAKALGEGKDSVEREVGAQARAALEARDQAKTLVRQLRLSRVKVEPAALIAELEAFYTKRLQLPPGAETVLALFTMNTFVYEVFDTTPYLQIDSATGGCGKTTLLFHLEATSCRPYLGADPSEAALFRRIDRDRPTWLLDEAAVLHGHDPRAIAIRAVLDAGYREGATVSRCEGENNELRDFEVYCPKVFALVGSLRGTTLDRCILIHMMKAKGLSKTRRRVLKRLAAPLREKLEAYAAQYRSEIERLYDQEPDAGYWPELSGREEELWGPLLTHAKLAGQEVEKSALAVALSFSRRKAEVAVAEDHDFALAQELVEAVEELKSEMFSPSELVSTLAQMESWGAKLTACKSDQAKVCAIGIFLNRFRLASRKRDRGGTRYERRETLEVITRHIPDLNATNATPPANMLVAEVASPPGENAIRTNGDITEDREPVPVAANTDGVANPAGGNATGKSRINTGPVASRNSSLGDINGVLKF
jgi:hypothetical protein